MKVAICLGGILVLLLAASQIEPPRSQQPVEAATVEAPEPEPEVVTYQWDGSGALETETVALGRESILKWDMQGDMAVLIVTVHDAATGRLESVAINETQPGSGKTRIRSAGNRYLKINAANCNWALALVTIR